MIDIDGTICNITEGDYDKAVPVLAHVDKINKLYEDGNHIIYWTARGMSRNNEIVPKAYELFYSLTKAQLAKWGAKHHELRLGKPHYDIWIDRKAVNVATWLNQDKSPPLPYPIAEVADRYTICKLKHERVAGEDLSIQLSQLRSELDKYNRIQSYVDRLYKINGECWDIESDIRKGKEGLEEIGRRTLTLRDKNKIRVGIKNEIVRNFSEGFEDIKMNHASQE